MTQEELLADIYLNRGLYSKITDVTNWKNLVDCIKWDVRRYNGNCPHCKKSTVFQAKKSSCIVDKSRYSAANVDWHINLELGTEHGGAQQFDKQLICSLCGDILSLFFRFDGEHIQKVGTYPSLADIHLAGLMNDLSITKNKLPKELSKAIGLRAHSAHIGAFAYLRRVYENLIIDAEKEAKHSPGWDSEKFRNLRAQEKIEALKDYLPEEMVKMRAAYGILSNGIHELTEDECDKYFTPVLRLITMLLEEREIKRRREASRKELQKSIADIAGEIKK